MFITSTSGPRKITKYEQAVRNPEQRIDGTEWMLAWMRWRDHCEKCARDLWVAIQIVRNRVLPNLTPHDCAQVRELIDLLEQARWPL
jgi:hypothetical protein